MVKVKRIIDAGEIDRFRIWRKSESPYFNSSAIRLEEACLWGEKCSSEERDRILQAIRRMLISHSGQQWGHYNADTAVTEYRAILLKKVEEIL
jgi:hypothetical protein